MRRKIEYPTPAEDARINKGIAEDPDTAELTEEFFRQAKPAQLVLPPDVYADVTRRTRGPGRKPLKQRVTLRLDPDVVEGLRQSGRGWQGRVNAKLRELLSLG